MQNPKPPCSPLGHLAPSYLAATHMLLHTALHKDKRKNGPRVSTGGGAAAPRSPRISIYISRTHVRTSPDTAEIQIGRPRTRHRTTRKTIQKISQNDSHADTCGHATQSGIKLQSLGLSRDLRVSVWPTLPRHIIATARPDHPSSAPCRPCRRPRRCHPDR